MWHPASKAEIVASSLLNDTLSEKQHAPLRNEWQSSKQQNQEQSQILLGFGAQTLTF